MKLLPWWSFVLAAGVHGHAQAQGYGGTTYKCVAGGKVEYSDNRCAGASILGRAPPPTAEPAPTKEPSKEPPGPKTAPAAKAAASMLTVNAGPAEAAAPQSRPIDAITSCSELDHRAAVELNPVALYKARKRLEEMRCKPDGLRE